MHNQDYNGQLMVEIGNKAFNSSLYPIISYHDKDIFNIIDTEQKIQTIDDNKIDDFRIKSICQRCKIMPEAIPTNAKIDNAPEMRVNHYDVQDFENYNIKDNDPYNSSVESWV